MPSDPPPETLAETSDLPDAERRRRRRDLVITAVVIAAIAAVVVVERRITSLPEALPFGDSLLFLFLNAFNVVLIVLLIYLISRSFVKLIFERRSGVLGSHLNLKFALALFLVATVPMGLQYVVSSSFITASIDTWFSLQMDRAIDDSREVADAYYDAWTGNALHFGTQISEEIRAQRLLREGNNEELACLRPGQAAGVQPRCGPDLSLRRGRAHRHSGEPGDPGGGLREAGQPDRRLGARGGAGFRRRGHRHRDRRRDPRRRADLLVGSRPPGGGGGRGGREPPGAPPSGVQGRRDPRSHRGVPRDSALRGPDRRCLSAGPVALLPGDRALRRMVGASHGEGSDGSRFSALVEGTEKVARGT